MALILLEKVMDSNTLELLRPVHAVIIVVIMKLSGVLGSLVSQVQLESCGM